MIIHGISKLTLLDYPEHTACTLFTGACNFRCPFCHNSSLVLRPESEPVVGTKWLFDFLRKRKRLLQGVCITGGEPTLQKDLIPFIREIRGIGYKVKLDTNGYKPGVLRTLLTERLLDAAAMDVKSSPLHYAKAAGLREKDFDFSRIRESADLLMEYGRQNPDFYYEFRTTMVRGLQTEEDLISIGEWLKGAKLYFLQNFEDGDSVIRRGLHPFSREDMEKMAALLRPYISDVRVRGV